MDIHKLYEEATTWLYANGPRILIAAVVFMVGQGVIKLLKKWLNRAMSRRDVHSSVQPFLQSLIIVIFQILLVVVMMQILGIQLTIFAATLASLGVTVGLALSGTLQNFACGILILLLRPFKVGDNIVAQGQDGIVSSIQIFYTVLMTADNKTIIMPNSKLSNEVIVNVAREGNRKIELEIKFGYASDTDKVEEVINDTIRQSPNILPDPVPVIGVSQCEHDGFKVKTEVWANISKFAETKTALYKKIINDLKAAGIKLPGMA